MIHPVLHGKLPDRVACLGSSFSNMGLGTDRSVCRDRAMKIIYEKLEIATYYGILSSSRLRGPAVIALQALGAMVHGTSGRLRKAAIRAFVGMRLRKRTKTVEVEYEVESISGICSRSSTSVSEAVSLEEDCVSFERCDPGSHGCGVLFSLP